VTSPDPSQPPADRQRRTGVLAVVLVVGCLLGLAVWVTLGRTAPAPQRSPGTQGAMRSPQVAPTAAAGSTSPVPSSLGPGGFPVVGAAGPGGTLDRVDWSTVDYPLTCDGTATRVQDVRLGDVDGDGPSEAVVTVRCDAGAGSPPSALYVYDGRPGRLRLLGTLLRPEDDVLLTTVRVQDRKVTATGTSYSSDQVPRCCPDQRFSATWQWNGSRFRRAGE
jgi:hypothetical protein